MVEQVKELKPELQLALLTQHRQAPVFVEGKVHIAGVRSKALSRIAGRPLAEDITVHSERIGVEKLQLVSRVGAGTSLYRANAKVGKRAVPDCTPRIRRDASAAGHSASERGTGCSCQATGDRNSITGRG